MTAPILLACLLAATSPSQASDGWKTVFDGQSLEGWTTVGGRYDGKAVWTVEEGVLVGREGAGHAGGLIYTERDYADFVIELDAWITYPFDSGVFVRMRPDGKKGAQLTLDYRPGGEVGGIYADGFYYHNPASKDDWIRDGWNKVKVRCAGQPMHLSMWLNGVLVTDYLLPEDGGNWARKGKIGLQVHGGSTAPPTSKVMFRNVRVRELPSNAGKYWEQDKAGRKSLTAAGEAMGWRALFNGEDLTGWDAAGDGSGYRVQDGVLEFLTAGNSPHLATEKDYTDFQLRMDFQTSAMANSGLFLRAARSGGNPAFSGCEIQILDDFNWEKETGSKLKPYQFSGGLYGSVAPGVTNALKPLGEWNTLVVTYKGTRILTALNGRILYDVDTLELKPEQGAAWKDRASTGFIGLQRHAPGGAVEGDAYARFRNLYIREL